MHRWTFLVILSNTIQNGRKKDPNFTKKDMLEG